MGDSRHSGTSIRNDIPPPTADITNDQLRDPVISAKDPAIMGEITEPIPK